MGHRTAQAVRHGCPRRHRDRASAARGAQSFRQSLEGVLVLLHDLAGDLHDLVVLRIVGRDLQGAVRQLGHIERVALLEPQARQQLLRQDQAGRVADLLDLQLHAAPPVRCTFCITRFRRLVRRMSRKLGTAMQGGDLVPPAPLWFRSGRTNPRHGRTRVNLHKMLLERKAQGRPVTVGVVGAGKFGTMFLAQARTTEGMQVVAVADLNVPRARSQLKMASWPEEQFGAASLDDAARSGKTHVTDDTEAMIAYPGIEVIVEATGDPKTGIRLATKAIDNGKHIVMVNVEADALAGPLLARRAKEAGVVYSLAWGDQPALVCEHVDWARACGFTIVAAGKGTRYHPTYHQSTPDTVWSILDRYMKFRDEDRASINPKMFNSFVDGTKSGIEMTAICNATGLQAQSEGLSFPPASRFELAEICKPKSEGGVLEKAGVTEVTSSVYRDGSDVPHNLVMGTYVVFEAAEDNEYTRRCFREYSMLPDKSGRYAAL